MIDSEKKIAMTATMMIQAPQVREAVAETVSFRFISICPSDGRVAGESEMNWLRAFYKRRPITTAGLAACFFGALAGEIVVIAAKIIGG